MILDDSRGEQEVEPTDRVAKHEHEQRQLPGNGLTAGKERHGAVVRGDHAEKVPTHHGNDGDESERGRGKETVVDPASRGAEQIRARTQRIREQDERLLALEEEIREVVGDYVAHDDRDDRVGQRSR